MNIPPLIHELVAEGRWPRTRSVLPCENVPEDRVRALAAEESGICLFPPPFAEVRMLVGVEPFWMWPESDPDGIDFETTLVIGDFGLGSDAPIVLDYSADAERPSVRRLRWPQDGTPNRWVEMAPDVETFVRVLGL
jgi:hypothetical protein